MTINTETAPVIFLATVAAVALCAYVSWRRPDLRRTPALRVATAVALVLLVGELLFGALFMLALSGLPDMSEF